MEEIVPDKKTGKKKNSCILEGLFPQMRVVLQSRIDCERTARYL
jgi:hypothetical protein